MHTRGARHARGALGLAVSGGGVSVLDGEQAFLQIGIWQTATRDG